MPRLLTVIGSLLSLFTFIRIASESRSAEKPHHFVPWSIAVKAHSQFANWT